MSNAFRNPEDEDEAEFVEGGRSIQPASPVADSAAIIAVLDRAAANPAVDVAKLEKLLEMQERIMARNARMAFSAAMTAAQAEMRPVAADANNPQTHSRYASYAALDKALRPIYTGHGLALSFDTGDGSEGCIKVLCHLSHSEGFERTYSVSMPADGKGAKGGDVMTKTHAIGAAMTYGMRYLLRLIFNIAVGEDNDGNAPGSAKAITDAQTDELIALADAVGADKQKFCAYLKVESFADIPAAQFARARQALEGKRVRA